MLDSFWPESPRKDDQPPLGAGHPDDVLTNVLKAIKDLEKSLLDVETAVDGRLADVRSAMHSPLYLPTRSPLNDSEPGGLVSDAQLLEYDATLYGVTEVHLPLAVEFLRKAGNQLLASENIGAWQNGRPPGVGLGYSGFYDNFFLVLHGLMDNLHQLSEDLEGATDVLHATGLKFDKITDEEVAVLTQLHKDLQQQATHILG